MQMLCRADLAVRLSCFQAVAPCGHSLDRAGVDKFVHPSRQNRRLAPRRETSASIKIPFEKIFGIFEHMT